MRLISVTVRNYRIHREQQIVFDRYRTLIGGPNETGKSTLVEAIHRALFLKAKGNTEHHRAMQSQGGGQPEVELVFEADDTQYTLRKRFGPNGTANLLPSRGAPLAGDEAEQKLAEVLSVEAVAGKAMLSQWVHLWVWQGKACEDPSGHASAVKNDLVRRLQSFGAAAVLQSERDTRVAARMTEKYDAIYTGTGKVKAGSELDVATRAHDDALQRCSVARGRLAALESAAADLESARAELPRIDESVRVLQGEQEAIEERARRIAELQQQRLEEDFQRQTLSLRHEALKAASERITALERSIARDEAKLAPLQKEVESQSASKSELNRSVSEAQRTYGFAVELARTARISRDSARAQARKADLDKEIAQLSQRQARVEKLQAALRELEHQRDQLPVLDPAAIRKLQKLQTECEKAQHLVQSVATGIELLATDSAAKLGSDDLPIGVKRVLTEEMELTIGDRVRLRILPGGGNTLSDARREYAEKEKTLADALAKHGVDSVPKAVELLAQRDQIRAELEKTGAQIEALDGAQIREQLGEAAAELAGVTAQLERLGHQPLDASDDIEETSVQSAVKAAEALVEEAEAVESTAKITYETLSRKAQEQEAALQETQTTFHRQNQALEQERAELRVLIQTHGDEQRRTDALLSAEAELKAAQARVEAVQRLIEGQQPGLVDSDRKRVVRSLEHARERKAALSNQAAAAEVTLRPDGMEDPRAAHAAAELQLRAATERLERVRRQARAIELLHQSFQEEQRVLADQFTRPLAEKVSGYLQCLFGPSARASIELTDQGFSGLMISRGDATERFSFEHLSGGAQEQAAAAVRLAIAEVLAADHDHCLPVVFDDAFVYSDPDRVVRLQRMLDHAAGAGLQVVVLTCDPASYTSLGAHQVTLHRG